MQSGSAAVSIFASYQLGEGDQPGHLANDDSVVDGSGNGRNLGFVVGEGTISSSIANPAPGSSSYYEFAGRGFYVDGVFESWDIYQSNNAGIEAWVRVADLGQGSTTIFNASGLNLVWQGGAGGGFGARMGETAVGGLYSPSNSTEWVHLALVRDSGTVTGWDDTAGGVSTFYVNGVAFGSTVTTGSAGTNSVLLGVTAGASAYFNGAIDEARIFTFEPGAFSPSDLMIPEPSVVLTGAAGAFVMMLRRRRR